MTNIRIKAGPFDFEAKLEEELAPNTCKKFKNMLPSGARSSMCDGAAKAAGFLSVILKLD